MIFILVVFFSITNCHLSLYHLLCLPVIAPPPPFYFMTPFALPCYTINHTDEVDSIPVNVPMQLIPMILIMMTLILLLKRQSCTLISLILLLSNGPNCTYRDKYNYKESDRMMIQHTINSSNTFLSFNAGKLLIMCKSITR